MAFSLQMMSSSSSSSSVLGRREKGSVRFPNYKIPDSRSYPRSTWSFRLNPDSVRPMILSSSRPCSSSSSSSSYSPPKSSSFSSSPWLMLPHLFEAGPTTTMKYKFYSLAENKVVTVATEFPAAGSDLMVLRGSSHGWLALLNPRNFDLFLYNPISHRRINLPSVGNLPNYPTPQSSRDLEKLILSCSPDEEEEGCRAAIINDMHVLAFCCPGRSDKWTLLGDLRFCYYGLAPWNWEWEGKYMDCVYSSQHQALFALTGCDEVECWDLRDPLSPSVIKTYEKKPQKMTQKLRPPGAEMFRQYLVIAGQDLLVVSQYLMEIGGSFTLSDGKHNPDYSYVTVDFDVHRYDPEDVDHPKYVEGSSLGGWAIFVGFSSHAIALPVTDFPELEPNSIYFTDPTLVTQVENCVCGGHDIGIFNYEDKTVSRCYYPSDVRKIFPAPMWFFPDSKLI
ncbi:hypothetical protein STAS_26471 [Striga asiatica]|uniref:KIB1-4 beta-propeller domain-containing protein n=1 Tax=Striga asiatica TaxID=4170 RepID=A0A5A7QV70_STRAF|nr:hypothetical protein STAS_26471 [Striga asiatica]